MKYLIEVIGFKDGEMKHEFIPLKTRFGEIPDEEVAKEYLRVHSWSKCRYTIYTQEQSYLLD